MWYRDIDGNTLDLMPNWIAPVSAVHEFFTQVTRSEFGIEQRLSLRQAARVRVSYTALLRALQRERLYHQLKSGFHGPVIVPVPWRSVAITAPVSPGDTVLSVASTPWWADSGVDAVLVGEDSVEVVEIDATTSTTISVVSGLTYSFDARARLYLAAQAQLPASIDQQVFTEDVSTLSFEANLLPGSWEYAASSSELPAGMTLDSREVFLERPNYAYPIRVSHEENRISFDPGYGVPVQGNEEDLSYLKHRATFSGLSAERSEALIDFFYRQKGQLGEFWVPEWNVRLEGLAGVGATRVRVEGHEVANRHDGDEFRKALLGVWPDGHVEARLIVGITAATNIDDEPVTQIEVSPAFGRSTIGATFHWLYRARFSSDRLETNWITPTVSEMTMAWEVLSGRSTSTPRAQYSRFIRNFDGRIGETLVFPFNVLDYFTIEEIDNGDADITVVMEQLFYIVTFGNNDPGGNWITRLRSFDEEDGTQISLQSKNTARTGVGPIFWDEVFTLPAGTRWAQIEYFVNTNVWTDGYSMLNAEVWRA